MRIISGKHKGRRLTAPKNLPVRPTTDMAKEGLFNMLNNDFHFGDLKVLDLFAGTGNISYEFASRGTKQITAIDSHKACTHYISKTAEQLDFRIITIKTDVFTFLERTSENFDLIFADPPYAMDLKNFELIVQLVFGQNLLRKDGKLILEHARQMDLSHMAQFNNSRKYGASVFSFFKQEERI